MTRQIVFTAKAAKPPATYSQAVKAAVWFSFRGRRLPSLRPAPWSEPPFRNRPASA